MSKIRMRSTPESLYRGIATPCVLQPEAIEIWHSPNELAAEHCQALRRLLSPNELERAATFRFERHCNQYVIGRGLLRILLAGYLQVDPLAIRFQYTSKGKPELLLAHQEFNIHFNIAHSGQIILLGFALERRIGIDVEEIRTDIEIDEISQRFFSRLERQYLASLPLSQRHDAFFRCWTRKEALLKGTGEGLSVGLDSFDVLLNPGEDSFWLETGGKGKWLVQDVDMGIGYAGAAAVEYLG